MDLVQRVIMRLVHGLLLASFVLALSIGDAYAGYTVVYRATFGSQGVKDQRFTAPEPACLAAVTEYPEYGYLSVTPTATTYILNCNVKRMPPDSGNLVLGYVYRDEIWCPGTDVYNVQTKACGAAPPTCTGGQTLNTSTNKCESKCTSGRKLGPSFSDVGVKCIQTPTGSCQAEATTVTSSSGTTQRYYDTGSACSPGDPGAEPEKGSDEKSQSCTGLTCPPKSDGTCASGYSPGSVNGTSMCAKNTSDTKTESESSSDGSGKTTSQTTSCTGSSCTTTTTTGTTNSSGGTTTTTTTTNQSKDGYCAENPKASACSDGDESVWGGSCETAFVCDGDAVQCAQAMAGWQAACSLRADRTHSTVTAGQAAVQGTDKTSIEAGLGKGQSTPFTLSGMISSVPAFGSSGGCPADASVSVGGVGVTIPFSSLCGMFNMIGIALQGLAYLIAAFIVFRRA